MTINGELYDHTVSGVMVAVERVNFWLVLKKLASLHLLTRWAQFFLINVEKGFDFTIVFKIVDQYLIGH